MKEGIIKDMSNEEYHKDRTHVSSSGLKLILDDPKRYYQQYVLGESEIHPNQAAFDFGSYIHTLILEPHLVEKEYIIWDGIKRGKKWEEFKDNNQDKIIISASQQSLGLDIQKSFNASTVEMGKHGFESVIALNTFVSGGNAEETFCTSLEDLPVKARFDYRKEFEDHGIIIDLKTTSSRANNKEDIESICSRYCYDLSAALYCDIAEKVLNKPHDFYFIFLNKNKSDLGCTLCKASDQMIEKGREKYKKAIGILKEAKKTGVYYNNTIIEIDSI